MPALIPRLIPLSLASYMWQPFRAAAGVADEDKMLVPDDYGPGPGTLDLARVRQFFQASTVDMAALKCIRLRNHLVGDPMREPDIEEVFDAYCNQLDARNVVYHYNAHQSPFDSDFTGISNCQGRAKGFLQLMAMLGVRKEHLAYCIIGGGAGEDDRKVCQKPNGQIVAADVRWVPGGPAVPALAPNAVRIDVVMGALQVVRTPREPFANHYATRISVPGLSKAYWDPLERYCSRNGFSDVFASYEPSPELLAGYRDLERQGVRCLANPDDIRERLYLLSTAARRPASALPAAYYRQAAFVAVEAALMRMSDAPPQVLMVVDNTDYDPHAPTQPRAFKHMFPS